MKKWLVLLLLVCLPVQAQASSYAVIDADTGRLLKGAAPHAKAPIASLTKMWTALIVIEEAELSEMVTISKRAVMSEGSSIYLQEGDQVTVETLLYGLLLRSGNDAATALAEHVGGSVEGFVKLMNEKARLYGLTNTTFANPSGLHDERHLSTAYETARQLQIAMQNETFRQIASTLVYKTWQNKHRLLTEDIGAIAGKTGYTKVAGRTLATYFERDDKEFIVVTINEGDDWRQHRLLADEIDEKYEKVNVAEARTYEIAQGSVTLKKPISFLVSIEEHQNLEHVLIMKRNARQGVWQVLIDGERAFATLVDINK